MAWDAHDLSTWRDVGRLLEQMGRGSTARLAKALNMDPSFLRRKLEGKGELTLSQVRAVAAFASGANAPSEPTRRLVPVYGYPAAPGGDRIAFDSGEVLDWMELPMGLSARGELFVVRAIGSSMEPRIFDGEALLALKNIPPAGEKDAIIEFVDGSAVVKTYRAQRGGRVLGHQYNPVQEVSYGAADVKAIHAVLCRL